ncbi:MAG: hypothetical protein EBV03_12245 [Proteobacteria bacterium]|nr:hypothetical protein [Pseudomonadota bacterium]
MGANAQSVAVVRPDGLVETFIRLDYPEGWAPPEGYSLVPDDELPEGWRRVPEPVPETVTARQIRLWLVKNGIALSAIESAIDAIPDQQTREIVRVEWEYAPYVERTHPWLIPLAQSLGLTEEQVDQAFREAVQI